MANTAPVRFLTKRFHLESTTATSDARFEGKLASIREENREIASRTINVASDIFAPQKLLEEKRLTQEDLFDNDLSSPSKAPIRRNAVRGSRKILPPIQEALLANNKWLAFCAAATRKWLIPGKIASIRCRSGLARRL
jgi:hypothetical protein